jgi:hypothetical protein
VLTERAATASFTVEAALVDFPTTVLTVESILTVVLECVVVGGWRGEREGGESPNYKLAKG